MIFNFKINNYNTLYLRVDCQSKNGKLEGYLFQSPAKQSISKDDENDETDYREFPDSWEGGLWAQL